jgi:hypothetical protein
MNEYQEIIYERDITELLHFTRTKNIESIKEHGLLTPKELRLRRIWLSTRNDRIRGDMINGTCLSVTFYNHYLLNAFKEKYNEKFCIIIIKPEILSTKKCYFHDINAASKKFEMSSKEYLTSADAFEGMFASKVDTKHGSRHRPPSMNSNEPTDVQAEIIVAENIEPKYIIFV